MSVLARFNKGEYYSQVFVRRMHLLRSSHIARGLKSVCRLAGKGQGGGQARTFDAEKVDEAG